MDQMITKANPIPPTVFLAWGLYGCEGINVLGVFTKESDAEARLKSVDPLRFDDTGVEEIALDDMTIDWRA